MDSKRRAVGAQRAVPLRHNLTWASVLLLVLGGLLPACRSAPDPLDAYRLALVSSAQDDLGALADLPRYDITLTVHLERLLVSGRETVQYTNVTGAPLEEIVFRLYPNLPHYGGRMTVTTVQVDDQPVTAITGAEDTALRVPLPTPLLPGRGVEIELDFTVEVQPVSGDTVFGVGQDILSLPDCYPLLAVRDEEDETGWRTDVAPPHADAVFSEVALYTVDVIAPEGVVVVGSGTAAEPTANEDGTRTWHLAGGPRREFALLLSADFLTASTTVDEITVTSYYLPHHSDAGRAALRYGATALRIYSELFGPYPYSDFRIVAAPLGYRGMEYPGLTLLGLDLYDEWVEELEFRVVHEVGHQWWYAQVGSDPIREPWLDEGLTEYSAYEYYRLIYGPARADELVQTRWRAAYVYAREQEWDAVVGQPASAFGGNYEAMVYAKAALFFHALRQQVGEDVYYDILRRYLREYRYRTATGADFLAVAEEVSGQDLHPLYAQWIGNPG
ncbi:MAG: M1 family metallopeptidase [Chloroflexota bacterium]|nr:M1 family metallopeptidase [Chloroflexota bacterium]